MFALRGPEFLVLFAACAALVYLIVEALISGHEMRLPSDPRIRDPYAIAYLRGEERELLRVVAMSLVLRQLLAVEGKVFLTVNRDEIDRAQVPIEKEVLRLCRSPFSAPGLIADPGFVAAALAYRRDLLTRGLIADDAVKNKRWLFVFAGIVVLFGIAFKKILVALSTGHSNVAFLMILAAVSGVLLGKRAVVHRTVAGSTTLKHLRVLFASLWRSRLAGKKLDGPAEAALLAAVFGVYTVPAFGRTAWAAMFPKRGSSNGSGCGSSSGCGGGGGCGGCGGCGS